MATVDFIRPGTQPWADAWTALSMLAINSMCPDPFDCENPECGEVWQYMGTVNGSHEFRHRMHPITGDRQIVRLDAATCEVIS